MVGVQLPYFLALVRSYQAATAAASTMHCYLFGMVAARSPYVDGYQDMTMLQAA